jgi:16S rRNA (uracil1498-N3)-methyltransferase
MDDGMRRRMATLVIDEGSWEQDSIELSAEDFHHLFRVRRLRTGDRLRVVDGHGKARSAYVERVDRQSAVLSLGEIVPSNESRLGVDLLVAAPRPQRASWLVEKATEVGVSTIRFINTDRGPRTYGPSTLARFRRVARSAVEQSGRAKVPEITVGHSWSDIEELLAGLDRCWVFDPGRRRERFDLIGSWERIGFLVGPEGGWEDSELEQLVEHGCVAAGLGERVLRVETAAIVAAAVVLVTPSVDTP